MWLHELILSWRLKARIFAAKHMISEFGYQFTSSILNPESPINEQKCISDVTYRDWCLLSFLGHTICILALYL